MSENEPQPAAQHWVLDKRVPVALIVTVMAGYAGGIWWMADLSNRVVSQGRDIVRVETDVGRSIARIEVDVQRRNDQNVDANNRIIRIEEKLANQSELLQEIKNAVSGWRATPRELQAR